MSNLWDFMKVNPVDMEKKYPGSPLMPLLQKFVGKQIDEGNLFPFLNPNKYQERIEKDPTTISQTPSMMGLTKAQLISLASPALVRAPKMHPMGEFLQWLRRLPSERIEHIKAGSPLFESPPPRYYKYGAGGGIDYGGGLVSSGSYTHPELFIEPAPTRSSVTKVLSHELGHDQYFRTLKDFPAPDEIIDVMGKYPENRTLMEGLAEYLGARDRLAADLPITKPYFGYGKGQKEVFQKLHNKFNNKPPSKIFEFLNAENRTWDEVLKTLGSEHPFKATY